MMYDPEAIYQDPDIEIWEGENRAMEIHANCKAGNHEWERGLDRVFCTWCGARYPLTKENSNGTDR